MTTSSSESLLPDSFITVITFSALETGTSTFLDLITSEETCGFFSILEPSFFLESTSFKLTDVS